MLKEYLTQIADAIRSALGVTSGTTYYVVNYEWDEENDLNIFTKTDEVLELTEDDIANIDPNHLYGVTTTTGENVYVTYPANRDETFCCAVSSAATINAQDFPDKIAEVYEAGKSEGGGTDWLYYATNCNAIYTGAVFPEKAEIVIKVKGATNYSFMFNNTQNIKSIKMISETQDTVVDVDRFCTARFDLDKALELVDFTEFNKKYSNIFNMFYNQTKLKTILGAMDLSSCTNTSNAFSSCSALEDIEFEKETIKISIYFTSCSLLSAESIQSIIDGLADLTGSTAQTLTVHATVGAKITDEQKAAISAKNWTLVY